MMHSASIPKPGSEFDAFLFAPVGDDGNGMLLSVLSALARLDVDPWQEAANLARLPRSTAIERLTFLIAALPGRPASQPDPEAIAARLIALLPGRTDSNVPSRSAILSGGLSGGPSEGNVTNRQAVVRVVVFNLILVAFMLGSQWLASSRTPPAQVAETPAATSGTGPAQSLTPNPGQ
jgi:hypothetical protein